jgi:hypothetical protein
VPSSPRKLKKKIENQNRRAEVEFDNIITQSFPKEVPKRSSSSDSSSSGSETPTFKRQKLNILDLYPPLPEDWR